MNNLTYGSKPIMTTIYFGRGEKGEKRKKELVRRAKKSKRSMNEYILLLDEMFGEKLEL